MNVKGKFVAEERLHGKEWCSVSRFLKVNFIRRALCGRGAGRWMRELDVGLEYAEKNI